MAKTADQKKTAVFFMVLSALSFAFMGATVKLGGDIPVFMKVFVRNLVIMVIILGSVARNGFDHLKGKKENIFPLVGRSVFGLIAVVLYFFAIQRLPLADSSMLNRLSPFFVTLFAAFFLKEKISKSVIYC